MGDLVPRNDNLVPLSRLQRELMEAEATKDIPRLSRVIGAAQVAAEAQRKVAKLAQGQGQPQEIVEAAKDGSRQAATVQIEAIAAAGRILKEMSLSGERAGRGGDWTPEGRAKAQDGTLPKTLAELGITDHKNVTRWGQIANIPDEVRAQYVEEATEKDADITMSGLLRYATPKQDPPERLGLEVAYDDVVRNLGQLLRYDSQAMAAHANNTKRKTQFRKLMDRMNDWVEKAQAILE